MYISKSVCSATSLVFHWVIQNMWWSFFYGRYNWFLQVSWAHSRALRHVGTWYWFSSSVSIIFSDKMSTVAKRSHKELYACTYCDKMFIFMSKLVEHQRIHTGEKPYACEICGKSFAQKGNLSLHFQLHTGEKPYSCEICGKRFNRKRNMMIHQNTHSKHSVWSQTLNLNPQAKKLNDSGFKVAGHPRHKGATPGKGRHRFSFMFEDEHDKSYKMTCSPSNDSDQLVLPHSLTSLRCLDEWMLGPWLPTECPANSWSDWADYPSLPGSHMSHVMRKPILVICEQQRCWSDCVHPRSLISTFVV